MINKTSTVPLPPHQLLLYGLPGLPLAMLGLPLYVFLPSFYADNLGLSLTSVGIALLLARGIDVLTDPLVGYLNDRVVSNMGRRKISMLLGMPILLVSVNFLLQPALSVGAFYLFFWSFIAYFGWTLINVAWQAWGAEISSDYHTKSSLSASREVFAVLGTVLVISVPWLLGIGDDHALTLAFIANGLWVLIPLCIVPLLLFVPDSMEKRSVLRINSFFGVLKSHPAISKLLPAYFINSLANALPATLFLLFVGTVLEQPDKAGLALMVYFLSAIMGLPVWIMLAKKIDKNRAWAIALLVSVISFAPVPFLTAGDFNVFLLVCMFTGFALGADVALPASIQADIAQQMRQQGNDQSGLLFGLWGLLTKLSLALAVGLAFPLLDLAGLNTSGATLSNNQVYAQSQFSLMVVAFLYAVVPLILKLWVIWRMWFFPFGKMDFYDYWSLENEQIRIK